MLLLQTINSAFAFIMRIYLYSILEFYLHKSKIFSECQLTNIKLCNIDVDLDGSIPLCIS